MPNVCANIDNPPNESIAVMAVSCVCICSGDWLKRKAPFVISNIPPNIAAIAEEERENNWNKIVEAVNATVRRSCCI